RGHTKRSSLIEYFTGIYFIVSLGGPSAQLFPRRSDLDPLSRGSPCRSPRASRPGLAGIAGAKPEFSSLRSCDTGELRLAATAALLSLCRGSCPYANGYDLLTLLSGRDRSEKALEDNTRKRVSQHRVIAVLDPRVRSRVFAWATAVSKGGVRLLGVPVWLPNVAELTAELAGEASL